MALHPEHELHRRRSGRNVGLALVMVAFVALVFGLSIATGMVSKLERQSAAVLEAPYNEVALDVHDAKAVGMQSRTPLGFSSRNAGLVGSHAV